MSELPEGWVETKFGDLGSWSSGGTPLRKYDEYYGGDIPWVKTGDLRDNLITQVPEYITELGLEKSSAKLFPKETLLVAMYGATIGRTGVLQIAAATNQACAALLPNGYTKELIPFLWKLAIALKPAFIAAGQGGAQPNISQTVLKKFSVKLPPLAEQKRIVAKIESLTAKSRIARENLARIDTLTKRYKQAILKKAFSGELTADWRAKAIWPDASQLADFADNFSYGSSSKSAKEGSVPVLRMGNIQDGKLVWDNLVYATSDDEVAKYRLSKGDVLFNRTNSPELVGKTALFEGEREAIYAGYLIRVRCSEELLPEYLTYALNSPEGRAYSWRVKSDGVSQSNINAKKLREFSFSIPSIPEQKEIVTRIEAAFAKIDRLTIEAKRALHLVDRLDEKILAKAFRGKLVPQDPDDESASVLLERIKAERAAQPKVKRRKVSRKKTEISKMAKTVLDALKEADGWLESQRLFQLCGIKDGTSTAEIELIYQQLLDLERQNKIEIKAVRNKDDIKQTDMVRFVA